MHRAATVTVISRVYHKLIIGADAGVVPGQGNALVNFANAFEAIVEGTVAHYEAVAAGR